MKITNIPGTQVNIPLKAPLWRTGGLRPVTSKAIAEAEADERPRWPRLALDAFREVGSGKRFFGCAHTLANSEAGFWDGAAADNNSSEQWRNDRTREAPARAAERRRLAEHERPKLDRAIDEELDDFVRRRKAERPYQWH